MREVCSYGTKFRENPILDINKIKLQLQGEVSALISGICRKMRIPRSALKSWGSVLKRGLISKLMSCMARFRYSGSVLSKGECKRELSVL